MLSRDWDLRGIPEWVLKEYLCKLGGVEQPEGGFLGADWQARITPLPDEIGKLFTFHVFRVTITGEAGQVEPIWRAFQLKVLRPGG